MEPPAGAAALAPAVWNEKAKSPLLEVTQGLRVKYQGPGESDKDAAAVRSNVPISPALGLFFFEVTIRDRGRDGYIGIGLCSEGMNTNRLPGWEKCSYGYHGDDGNAFSCSGTGTRYGPTFTTGDVIGCCVNYLDNTCFFTKNGVRLGVAFRDIDKNVEEDGTPIRLYPCVGLRTPGEEIEANFGSSPFVFDIESERREMETRAQDMVKETPLTTSGWQQRLNQMVTSYLVHHGYIETAQILARDMDTTINETSATIQARGQIRGQVLQGDIDGAIASVSAAFPGVFEKMPQILFQLKCRKFVEMIATAAEEAAASAAGRFSDERLDAILSFGQEVQIMWEESEYKTESYQAQLQEAFSLLAYPNPADGPMAHVLGPSRRETLACELNSAILDSLGQPSTSKLEQMVQHSSACLSVMQKHEFGVAAFLKTEQFM